MSRRAFLVGALLVAVVVAGVAAYVASGRPDGLQYVSDEAGFGDQAQAGHEPVLSGGLAGVVGVLLVLVVMGAVAYAVRRRRPVEHGKDAD